MLNLIKITDAPASLKGSYLPEDKDEEGKPLHGVYVRKHEMIEERLYYNNGNSLLKLIYPRIETTFRSDMVNDHNVYFFNNSIWKSFEHKSEALFNRILEKKKPMGSIDVDWNMVENTIDKAMENDLFVGTNNDEWVSESTVKIKISNTGKICDLFDLDALSTDYQNFLSFFKLPDLDKDWLKPYSEIDLSEFPEQFGGFDLGYPCSNEELIMDKLVLGYPIEFAFSTLSWLFAYPKVLRLMQTDIKKTISNSKTASHE